ncbi:GNAT family N-acetyltransferase [Ruminococcaceae bacterium OttesenSCG-928-I18]|nr:GNAT family N-acetyltransferase [Ruminococcaceae bacterium OttesenSCG-928-I18]
MGGQCKIRSARPEDANALAKLMEELTGLPEDGTALGEQLAKMAAREEYHVLAAECDGEMAGAAMGILCENLAPSCTPFLLVEDVVVSSAHQRKGVGKKLMEALEEIARGEGCVYICLVSQEKRSGAHRFYEALGYDADRGFQKFLGRKP